MTNEPKPVEVQLSEDLKQAVRPDLEKQEKAEMEKGVKDRLAEQERVKYLKMWEIDRYREQSPGVRCLPLFMSQFPLEPNETLIDFGCGSGRADLTLRQKGLKITLVDIAVNCLNADVKEALLPGFLDFVEGCLWDLPADLKPADYFYCCDVMEHIPEEKVDAVLENIKAKNIKGGFFNIATYRDGFGALIGEELHLTVKDAQWWLDKLSKHWRIIMTDTTTLDVKVAVVPL